MFNFMKKLFLLPLFLLLLCGSVFSQSASIVGKWAGAFPGQDGQLLSFTMTITDNTYQIDFGSDGSADVTGAYQASGQDQITIWDTSKDENACPSDQKGVYKYAFNGDTVTFTKITDPCEGRGGEPMTLKRM